MPNKIGRFFGLLRISELYHTVRDIIHVAKGSIMEQKGAKESQKYPSIKTVLL